jgi:hypothetical protein
MRLFNFVSREFDGREMRCKLKRDSEKREKYAACASETVGTYITGRKMS